jgi:hypothetical protein
MTLGRLECARYAAECRRPEGGGSTDSDIRVVDD